MRVIRVISQVSNEMGVALITAFGIIVVATLGVVGIDRKSRGEHDDAADDRIATRLAQVEARMDKQQERIDHLEQQARIHDRWKRAALHYIRQLIDHIDHPVGDRPEPPALLADDM